MYNFLIVIALSSMVGFYFFFRLKSNNAIKSLNHLFVRRSERGKGLATQMIISSVDSALDAGYTLIRVDATNYYTAKICQQLNFRLLYELPYCTYMGQDNKPVFTPKMPHRSAKVYVFESNMQLNR